MYMGKPEYRSVDHINPHQETYYRSDKEIDNCPSYKHLRIFIHFTSKAKPGSVSHVGPGGGWEPLLL